MDPGQQLPESPWDSIEPFRICLQPNNDWPGVEALYILRVASGGVGTIWSFAAPI